LDTPPHSPFEVIELGAGCGLFARYFLKSFAELCKAEKRDWFDHLVYLVTDASRRTVEQWRELGIFADFGSRVKTGTCEASRPETAVNLDGNPLRPHSLRCVITNYLLDVLPATIVRRGPNGTEELAIRTNLTRSPELLRSYTTQTPVAIRALAASDDPNARAALVKLLPTFEIEAAFQQLGEGVSPQILAALANATNGEPVIVNHEALQTIERWLGLTVTGGYILINDYGAITNEQVSAAAVIQRFGDTSQIGLNFPLLTSWLQSARLRVTVPDGDDERSIHSRLVTKEPLQSAEQAFSHYLSRQADLWFEEPSIDAGRFIAAGRNGDALEAFRTALARSPRDWQLLGRAAEFVGMKLGEHREGLALARTALELNPWYSPWLWSVLGDCLFALGRSETAHEAYLEALRIDPADTRANFNLSFTHLDRGEYDQALLAIARALAADGTGVNRERLLAKQVQILDAIVARWGGEQQRLAGRADSFRAAAAAGPIPPRKTADLIS
jgi:tetratricopeptide (TPR) repeat protein